MTQFHDSPTELTDLNSSGSISSTASTLLDDDYEDLPVEPNSLAAKQETSSEVPVAALARKPGQRGRPKKIVSPGTTTGGGDQAEATHEPPSRKTISMRAVTSNESQSQPNLADLMFSDLSIEDLQDQLRRFSEKKENALRLKIGYLVQLVRNQDAETFIEQLLNQALDVEIQSLTPNEQRMVELITGLRRLK